MKKSNLTALLLGAALFSALGTVSLNASDMKCGAGKCGDAMTKPAKKCGDKKDMAAKKCGDKKDMPAKKCGDKKDMPAKKCGAK